MNDDLKPPRVGELTLPRWQYWLARYNGVLSEKSDRIEKLEAALRDCMEMAEVHEIPFRDRVCIPAMSPAKHWRGKMTDYMQALINICFTMVTGVVIVGCFGAIIFFGLFIWQFLEKELR